VQSVTQRKRKDGSLLDVEVYGIPVVLSGKQIGTLGLYHDVSDLVRYRTAAMAEVAQAVTETTEPAAEEPLPVEEPPTPESETVMQEELAPETVLEEAHAPMEEPAMESEPLTSTRPPKRLVPIEDIEGIGPVYAEKLLSVGIKTTSDLLDQGKDRKGRELLVQKTGISHVLVLKWVNMADLMRIKGIGEEYSELLEKGMECFEGLYGAVRK
jgi:predicted flap endonuclease-1-like 5' DNA nuclease